MSATYLTLQEALVLHDDQLKRYGGFPGIRDMGLLLSISNKQATKADAAVLIARHLRLRP